MTSVGVGVALDVHERLLADAPELLLDPVRAAASTPTGSQCVVMPGALGEALEVAGRRPSRCPRPRSRSRAAGRSSRGARARCRARPRGARRSRRPCRRAGCACARARTRRRRATARRGRAARGRCGPVRPRRRACAAGRTSGRCRSTSASRLDRLSMRSRCSRAVHVGHDVFERDQADERAAGAQRGVHAAAGQRREAAFVGVGRAGLR